MKISVPREYVDYLEKGGRTESLTKDEPGYFILWPLADIEKMNAEYQVTEFMHDFLGFGSDGGGEMLAFDAAGAVWKLPFVGYSSKEDAWKVADRWTEVAARISDE
jgi:hypothetical protein